MSDRKPTPPAISNVLTMFYYLDLARAADWYANALGFERLITLEGLVLFQVHPGCQLALIGQGHGSQTPIAGRNKGAILSIETTDLEAWHARLYAHGVEGTGTGLQSGANGHTIEFKIFDPEGYTVEFFEWL